MYASVVVREVSTSALVRSSLRRPFCDGDFAGEDLSPTGFDGLSSSIALMGKRATV